MSPRCGTCAIACWRSCGPSRGAGYQDGRGSCCYRYSRRPSYPTATRSTVLIRGVWVNAAGVLSGGQVLRAVRPGLASGVRCGLGSPAYNDSDIALQGTDMSAQIDDWLLDILACPKSKAPLRLDSESEELVCDESGLAYPIRDGIPVLLIEEARVINEA